MPQGRKVKHGVFFLRMDMRVVAIIQARVGSSRLPGKVLMELVDSKTMVECILERISTSRLIDDAIISTTDEVEDEKLVNLASSRGWSCFRGSVNDVLGRFADCAEYARADVIVRMTADCPFIDPDIVDEAVETFISKGCDFLENNIFGRYPHGLDLSVFSRATLDSARRNAVSDFDREHVIPYIKSQPEHYRLFFLPNENEPADKWSDFRWTVDYPQDLKMVRMVYQALAEKNVNFSWSDIVTYLEVEPGIAELNCITHLDRN